MRWPVKPKKSEPSDGIFRYRIKFAWVPVRVTAAWGPSISWAEEMIWLEKVVEVQRYSRFRLGTWYHHQWIPLNEFTISLYEHNNQ